MEFDEAAKAIEDNVIGVQGDVSKLADLDRLYETVNATAANAIARAQSSCAFDDAAQRSLLSSVAIRLSR
jgi:hypothetical protein